MALLRAIPLKNFLDTALSTTASGTALSTTPPESGQKAYGALHLTAVSTARTLVATVQAASSSGFGAITTEFAFAMTTERGSTFQVLNSPSTDRAWRRARWTMSTAGGSTGGSWNGFMWIGFR